MSEDERSYYHITWTTIDEEGNEKEVPLGVAGGDGECVVLYSTPSSARGATYTLS